MKRIFTFFLSALFAVCAFAQDFTFNYTGPIPTDWMVDYYYVSVADMATATGFNSSEEFLTWYDALPLAETATSESDVQFMAIVTAEGDSYAYSNWGNGFWLLDDGSHCEWYTYGTPTWSIGCYGLDENRENIVFFTEVNGYLTFVGGEHMEGTVAVNGNKRATLKFSVDLEKDPEPELSKMTKVGNDISFAFEQYPANKEAKKSYDVNLLTEELRSGILDLGFDFSTEDIANHIFVKQYDTDGQLSDKLSFVRGEVNLGPVYNESTGAETEALCLASAGDYKAIMGDFSFENNVFTFGFGQKANVFKVGDHRTVEVYFVNVDENKYAILNLDMTIVESKVKHETEKAKMRKVGEETMTYTRGINDGWDYTTEHYVDIQAVSALFGDGVTIGDLTFKILDTNDEFFIDDYTCNTEEIGFWMTMDSHNNGYSWGSKLYYVFSQYLPNGWLTIGHMPEIFEGGEKTSGSVFLTYGDMYYEFHSNITIGEAAVTGVVGEQNVTIISDPNEDIFTKDIPNLSEVATALGCTEADITGGKLQAVAGLAVGGEEFTDAGFCEDDGGYPFNTAGAWIDPESETFLDDVALFVGINGAQLSASAMKDVKAGETLKADVALQNDKKYYVFHVTVCDEETAIRDLQSTTSKQQVIYNVNGQRVGQDYKGIVIINGKKTLVR